MTTNEIREKYLRFFKERGHVRIPPSPLVLENDPTTLFTSSGMQQLVPYLKGEPHPKGKRLVDSQPSFRSQDIEEVGDTGHTTFFEMLGNWSLGDYFKAEQIPWIWEFFTKELGLPKDRLWVSVFEGTKDVPKDEESIQIWKSLGVPEERIKAYGVEKNWWSVSGTPEEMPVGQIGGPDSEVFYELNTPHHPKYGEKCHPNCQCGRFLEIGNSVFMQYKKNEGGALSELPQKNVDFGGGLERITQVVNGDADIFKIDLFSGAKKILDKAGPVQSPDSGRSKRIILDHLRASLFIVDSKIEPANKEHGYVLRRLIRRAALHSKIANVNLDVNLPLILAEFGKAYSRVYPSIGGKKALEIISEELQRFERALDLGMKEILSKKKGAVISGPEMFDFYQTYGYPPELIREFAGEHGLEVDMQGFEEAKREHQEKSRATSATMFSGKLNLDES